MAKKLRDTTKEQLPFISVLNYGEQEYVGIIINQDQFVTTFYDIDAIRTPEEKNQFILMGETWWWESNRQIPINIFLKAEIDIFKYCIKTFNSKGVRIVLGPTVNLLNMSLKRAKRRSVELVRKI
ncbi:MAG: hypothetical protein EBS49_04855 [Verrucomicrobia bacterium]|nr:hypothetical protein [Verrucomicrobiota bacterium]